MNAADMQRVRMSLPYYRENGWEPVVLAIDPIAHGGVREDALLATVPDDIGVHRCRAFSPKWSRRFGVGNLGLRSWLHLFLTGMRIIRREKIDLIFFSNTQFVTFTLGRIWRWLLGVPYVIDLQDPWRTNHYTGVRKNDRPGGWKYEFARLQADLLEGWSFRRLSGLMSVSQSYIDDLQRRYHWFSGLPAEVIGFGASEADLVAAAKIKTPPPIGDDAPIRLLYTGVAGPVMQPALEVLFDGLKAFLDVRHDTSKLRLDFLGTSYAPVDTAQPSVRPIAQHFGIDNTVSETPLRMGLLEALREQAASHALLLLGTSDPAYSASKLYPYYLSGRPMLAIVLAGSGLERLLRSLSCAVIVTFEMSGPNATTRSQLAAFFSAMLAGFPSGSLPTRNDKLFRKEYLAGSLTRRQCLLFDQAIASSEEPKPNHA